MLSDWYTKYVSSNWYQIYLGGTLSAEMLRIKRIISALRHMERLNVDVE